MESTRCVFISTYELGRQPFGLASPAAWLRRASARVTCLDLSREPLREAKAEIAGRASHERYFCHVDRLSIILLLSTC